MKEENNELRDWFLNEISKIDITGDKQNQDTKWLDNWQKLKEFIVEQINFDKEGESLKPIGENIGIVQRNILQIGNESVITELLSKESTQNSQVEVEEETKDEIKMANVVGLF